mmetsp:Transcript_157089/g.500952  ORF Transcript_157089/g.500952 Transcript_157089/m.500952 type:complete len:119 (+) Transcript_157089:148-504(+)
MDYTRDGLGTKLIKPREHWMKELKNGRTVWVKELGRAGLGHGDGAQLRTEYTLDVLRFGDKEHHAKHDGSSTSVARASAMEKTDEVVWITARRSRSSRRVARSSMRATSAKSRQSGRQ